VVAGVPPAPLGSPEPHPPTAAAMSRISSAAPSRRTRRETLDVARRALAGGPMLPPSCPALPHPVTFQVKTAAFSSRPCLRSNLLRDHEPRHRRRPSTPGVRDQPADPRRRTRQGAVSPSRPRWRRRRLAPGRPCPHPTEQIWSSMPSWRREGVCWAQPDDGSRLVAVPDGSRARPPMPDSRCAVDPRRTGAATGLADRAVAELTCRYASRRSSPCPDSTTCGCCLGSRYAHGR
jgi:hypothetical protein